MSVTHDVILFDLDGTLSDPLVGIGRSINYALSHFGYSELPLNELTVHIGPPLDQAFRALTGSTSSSEMDRFVAELPRALWRNWLFRKCFVPGHSCRFAKLAGAGVTLGVCTSKRVDMAEKVLELFGLRSYFSFVNGAEIGTHKWQQIQITPRRGRRDSLIRDGRRSRGRCAAAHRNGLHAAGVLWGHGSRDEARKPNSRDTCSHHLKNYSF
jgi:phosphoglycolate phosphatase